MEPCFIKGTAESLPKAAAVTFDKFHAVKIINEAVDQVSCRAEEPNCAARAPATLAAQSDRPVGPTARHQRPAHAPFLKTGRAYQIRLAFQELYEQSSTAAGASYLKAPHFWATHSRLPPIIDAARTVKRHWQGILRWFDSKIANGLIEGINSLVAAKAGGAAYRSSRNLKAMV